MIAKRCLLVFVSAAALVTSAGCAQGPWAWLNPQRAGSEPVGEPPAGGFAALLGDKPDPKAPKNPFALARLTERQGQSEKAERLYQEIIKKTPNHAGAHHRLGVLYARQGKMAQAEEHFARALALQPDQAELLGDAGYFYYLAGRAQEAERCLRRALELEPANQRYCTNLALAVAEQGRRDEAYALFRRAGSEKDAAANMAFVLAQQGDYQQALSLYDRVLTEDPSMRVAADAMIELSKRAESLGKTADGRAVPANRGTLASATDYESSTTTPLATVSLGRFVPPPWVAGRGQIADAPTGMASALHASPASYPTASPASYSTTSPASYSTTSPPNRNPSPPTVSGNDHQLAVALGEGSSTEVPCAYVAPNDADSQLRGTATPSLFVAGETDGKSAQSVSVPATVGDRAPASAGNAFPASPGAPAASFAHAFASRLWQLVHPAALAMFAGILMITTGTIAWLRHKGQRGSALARDARRNRGHHHSTPSRFVGSRVRIATRRTRT